MKTVLHRIIPAAGVIIGALLLLGMKPVGAKAKDLPPDSLALYRLSKVEREGLQSATRAQITLDIKPKKYAEDTRDTQLPSREQGQTFVAGLRALLLDDRAYAAEYEGHQDIPESMLRVTCRLSRLNQNTPDVVVDIYPDIQELIIHSATTPNGTYPHSFLINYVFVAPDIVALLKQAFPGVPQIQMLTAKPLSPYWMAGNVSPLMPRDVSPDMRLRLAQIHSGITRAELLKGCTTQGGLSTRFYQSYVLRSARVPIELQGVAGVNGLRTPQAVSTSGLVKVDVYFAPRGERVKWVKGRGIFLNPTHAYQSRPEENLDERPDDIVVHVSEPYLQGSVGD